ncbi:glycoside hydrolase family protein [Acinetobacter larvae]|uniref:Lysozyme n=1 Tax=Acinetobacter larvae TaxID=1789224 RepID=A0A1B2LZD8_9GAMM|nr:glycoside hydrolase family protein [Acinetobacter larvae]AOA58287.1 lysozyme [Acinetobacter larvae]
MSKSKYLIAGTLAASLTAGGFFISGVSDQQVQETAKAEGFTAKPIIPVKGDVPTIGHGTTKYPNGVRVKMSDPEITRKQAHEYLKTHINQEARGFNNSLNGVKVSQAEYDLYMDFVYNFGIGNWQSSSMLRNLKAGQYTQACKSLLLYKFSSGRNCSIRSNGCYGVWTRQVDRHKKCLEAQ